MFAFLHIFHQLIKIGRDNTDQITKFRPLVPLPWFMVGSRTMRVQLGSPTSEGIPTYLDQEIARERFRMVLSMTPPATVMSSAFAIAAAWFFYSRLDHPGVIAWLILKLTISAARALQQIRQFQQGDALNIDGVRQTNFWLWVAEGCAWGLAGMAALAGQDSTTLMVAITLAGVCGMAAFTLQAHWPYVAAYCLPALLPISLIAGSWGNSFGLYVSGAMCAVTICLLTVSKQAEKRISNMLQLRFTNARLAQEREAALKLVERQIEEKSQFVATMSHELRTPLHGMLGLTRMLQSSALPDSDKQRLGLIERSGEHLLTVINNILDFTRIEGGHLVTESRPFDLHALVTDVCALHGVTAQAKSLAIHWDGPLPDPYAVMGDAPRVRQILLNLIGNAVKFTQHGGIWIQSFRRPSQQGQTGHMVFRITDTGVGISAADIGQIFTAFKQADGSSQQRKDGSGLGLTISRAMAHAMGGDITCTSVLGQGSTFELTLPLDMAPTDHTQPDPKVQATPLRAPASIQTKEPSPSPLHGRVLLAEDNEVNAMVVEAQLRQLGLDVEHCADGNAVIQSVCRGNKRPDLILMDCLMPMLDGFESTRLIRADEQNRQLPHMSIVALTANALSEDEARCLEAGMDGYLSKPFTEDQLLAVLSKHLPQSTNADQCTSHTFSMLVPPGWPMGSPQVMA